MRILIDECLNWRLGRALTGHFSVSVQKMGWGGIKNGALLELAAKEFDVFLTGDRNLSCQQDIAKCEIAVVILHAPGTQLHQTLPLIPKVQKRWTLTVLRSFDGKFLKQGTLPKIRGNGLSNRERHAADPRSEFRNHFPLCHAWAHLIITGACQQAGFPLTTLETLFWMRFKQ